MSRGFLGDKQVINVCVYKNFNRRRVVYSIQQKMRTFYLKDDKYGWNVISVSTFDAIVTDVDALTASNNDVTIGLYILRNSLFPSSRFERIKNHRP